MTIAKQILASFSGMKDQQHELVIPDNKQITISTLCIANYASTAQKVRIWVERADEWWNAELTPQELEEFWLLDVLYTGTGGFLVPDAYVEPYDAKYLTMALTMGPKDRMRVTFLGDANQTNPPAIYVSLFGSVEDRGSLPDVLLDIQAVQPPPPPET